jgi:chemotaxis protein MotB
MGVPVRTSFAAARREKMAQRRADDGHWQLSFADMMTLLLAFFMVLLSVSAVDLERYLEVAESMNRAMGSKSQPVASQKGTLRAIKKQVQESMGPIAHAVILEDRPDAVAIHLKGGFFFESGSADLSPQGHTLSGYPGRGPGLFPLSGGGGGPHR